MLMHEVRCEVTLYQYPEGITWELEVTRYRETRGTWSQVYNVGGEGAIPGQLLQEMSTAFEATIDAMCQGIGVQLELPFP